jgi:cytoskeletal protein CcmA (bactofilin family)
MLRMGRGNKNEEAGHGAHETARDARQTQATQATPAAPPFATPNVQTEASRAQVQPTATRPAPVAVATQAQRPVQVEQGAAASRAVTESESLARAVKDGGVGGFVGGTSALTGEINFRGMMRVDGRLSGRVHSQDGTLIVSSGGRVEAEVAVAVAKINGTVEGDITATERVELGRTARVSGNVQTPALVVEEGAIFEGSCRMTKTAASPARAKNAA